MPKKTEVVKDLPEPAPESEVRELPFRDGVVTIPAKKGQWPTRALIVLDNLANISNQDALKAMEYALGPQQWEFVLDSTGDEFDVVAEAFIDATLEILFGKKKLSK